VLPQMCVCVCVCVFCNNILKYDIPVLPQTKMSMAAKPNSGHVCTDMCDSAKTLNHYEYNYNHF
jgi:hypothetical protein